MGQPGQRLSHCRHRLAGPVVGKRGADWARRGGHRGQCRRRPVRPTPPFADGAADGVRGEDDGAGFFDLGAVESALRGRGQGRAFVVTESYFSMDADSPDLFALRRLCDEHGAALVVDEAHALGVLGPEGRGLCAQADVRADAIVGTFGKAFGAAGAFVAGCPSLVQWLWNRARTFVFSTGMSPAGAAAALAGVKAARVEPERRQRVLAAAGELRAALLVCGVTPLGFGHIVPWVLGEARVALAVAEALQARGLDARAIRPPSVPVGTARIRLTVTAAHSPTDIHRAASTLAATWQQGRSWPAG